ncbi:Secretion system apparatus protein SsaU [Chlamydiales bacterium SCGC AB-751-O23]|jgi:type III secretion protein U|nr:Secretion system apparatus protein SsaU [Chlamydiales bacterium SCGC AB-751-O23]
MGEKTEKPTQKKLRDARKKGQVAKSQDMPSAFTFITALSLILFSGDYVFQQLASFQITVFKNIPNKDLTTVIPQLMYTAIDVIMAVSLPLAAAVATVGVATNIAVVGPMFSTEVFKFDIKKFNPIDNIKAKFKLKTLVELIKSILKLSGAAYIIFTIVFKYLNDIIYAVSYPVEASVSLIHLFLVDVIIKIGLFFFLIAMFDFWYQKHTFEKEMMMEKHEIKQEHKNSEGDPQIKGKRKEIAREMAYDGGGGVKRSKAVVSNPEHVAVAIGYEPENDIAAPFILDMGKGKKAEMILKKAEKYNVPIMRNVPLAHTLIDTGEILQFIPKETFQAVAEILQWINSMDGNAK